jgi:hypothetical protein
MQRRSRLFGAVLSASLVLMLAHSALANGRGYDIWFSGHVLSVDLRQSLVRIARGPTETAEAGIEDCILPRGALMALRPGMEIEAEADTRRRPWTILHLRIVGRTRNPRTRARLASVPLETANATTRDV